MVWSAASGTSIVLPTDHVTGDGKNYIVIGDDVPPELATRIQAGIVFHTSYPTVEAAGDAINVWYWVFGIDLNGALVLSAYYAVKGLMAGAYLYNQLTLLKFQRNSANGNLELIVSSDDWGEALSASLIVNGPMTLDGAGVLTAIPPGSVINIDTSTFYNTTPNWMGYQPAGWGPGELYKDACGIVHLEALAQAKIAIAANVGFATIGTLPVGYRPRKQIMVDTNAQNAFARFDIMPSGDIRLQINPAIPIGGFVDLTCSFMSTDIS